MSRAAQLVFALDEIVVPTQVFCLICEYGSSIMHLKQAQNSLVRESGCDFGEVAERLKAAVC